MKRSDVPKGTILNERDNHSERRGELAEPERANRLAAQRGIPPAQPVAPLHGAARRRQLPDLLARANADPAWFWDAVSDDLGLVWQRPYTQVMDTSRGVPWTTWYTGGQFNYVANALDKHASGPNATKAALIWEGEDGEVRRYTYAELLALTNQTANALASLGVGKGDRVGIYMPMIPEVVAATLACGKLGAIYTPIFSGYGAERSPPG